MWMKSKRFSYPYTNIRTAKKPLEVAPLPSNVKIPLLRTQGRVGEPTVLQGQVVKEGDPIGKEGDFLFHASISGEVKQITIEEVRIDSTKIVHVPVVEIHFGGRIIDWDNHPADYLNRSSSELKKEILSLGVENLNPTSCMSIEDILNFPQEAHLVISAIEFSPMVNFLEEILLQEKEKVHIALDIVKYILKPQKTTILVAEPLRNHYHHERETVIYWDSQYPNGHESSIFRYFTDIKEVTKNLLTEKKIIIIDVQTLWHIYNAVVLKKPLIEVFLTIEGKLAKYPGHYLVRLGSKVHSLIEDIGIYTTPKKITSGIIFFSDIIYNLHARAITTDIYSLFLLDEEGYHYEKFDNCIQCNLCHVHCPVNLYPYDLASSTEDLSTEQNLVQCINCGICSYTCPSRIPLGYFLEIRKKGSQHG